MMTQDHREEYRGRLRLLAAGLQSHPPGRQIRLVLFLGAGAPREAGLPLADELKNDIIKQVFKDRDAPKAAKEGRLEDLMQLLQTSLGNDGYELVARKVREFKELPSSYKIIGGLISDRWVEAVVTTNFDLLFEIMAATKGYRFHFMMDDNSFEGNVLTEETVIAQLHGSALNPATMKGSWTDVNRALPAQRQKVLTDLMTNHITVFVGYSARDEDIIPTLEDISKVSSKPIWWVDPAGEPTAPIERILGLFRSTDNYLPIDSTIFFNDLQQELALPPYRDVETTARSIDTVRRIQAGYPVRNFLDNQELINKRRAEDGAFKSTVEEACGEILDSYTVDISRLNQKASRRRRLSEIHDRDFGSVIQFLRSNDAVEYHCVTVGFPGAGSLELVLHPKQAGRGGGLSYEFWFDIVAATIYFQEFDDGGSGIGKGEVWGAVVHTIEFPGSITRFNDLKTWLNQQVRELFQDGINRFRSIQQSLE